MPQQQAIFTEDHPVRIDLERRFGIQFVRFLGRGGFNEAWHVIRDDAPLALKISIEPLDVGSDGADNAELEIAKTPGINQHPFIVKYFGRLSSRHLVTQWELGGESLREVVERAVAEGRTGLTWTELLHDRSNPPGYMLQVAKALDDFAALGHHHRDIKPANLILFGPYVKLADLGLAKRATLSTQRTIHVVGTLGYRPPEAERGQWTATSDLYSAAASYVRLRTGHEPFGPPDDPHEIVQRQRAGDPIVDGLEDFEIGPVRHGLAPDPKDRPQSGVLAFFQTIRPGRQQTWFTPSVSMPEPNLVQVKEVEIPEIRIQPEPVRIVAGDTGGLPDVPAAILDLLGAKQGLEQALHQLRSEDHPSLRPAQAALRAAQRQLDDLQNDLKAHDLEMPEEARRTLFERLVENAAEAPSKLCQLAPDLSVRTLLPYVLRVRNVEVAKQALNSAQNKYRRERDEQIGRLEGELEQVETKLEQQQEEDLNTVLKSFFHRLGQPPLFPIEQWLDFEPLLVARHYPWDDRQLLEQAEAVHAGCRVKKDAGRRGTKGIRGRTNRVGSEFVRIPAGEFLMGSPENEKDRSKDEFQHLVRITRPFYMGIYPVTVAEFRKFVEATGYNAGDGWKEPGFEQDDSHPVVRVSWDDAQAFCAWLSEKEGVVYELPTEAQWEYACRGGASDYAAFGIGDGKTLTSKLANFDGNHPYGCNEKGSYLRRTTPVGSYTLANGFGLFDMHGNVWEWCQDWYDADYYRGSPKDDPPGPNTGSVRVLRGGSWNGVGSSCRSADRDRLDPAGRYGSIGFRLVSR
ncbi:MAG: SUMF1/EgtB/PvdO family nonheme iron enzyme [Pirellulaceae bacterium]|nr:SUMF1/EgtB/PvdO family nonheme iron enzyme [Pirellulaceae bacterium]